MRVELNLRFFLYNFFYFQEPRFDSSNYLNHMRTLQEILERAIHANNDKAANVEKLRMEVDTLEREVLYLKFVLYSFLLY